MKPAYLIAGDDEAKIARTRGRLRERAEREGGPGALEVFEAGRRPPLAGRRGGGRLTRRHLADRLAPLPARRRSRGLGQGRRRARPSRRSARSRRRPRSRWSPTASRPRGMAKAVEKAGGEVLSFALPRERDLPKQLVADARELGFELEPGGRPPAGGAPGSQADAPPHGAGAPRALGRGGRQRRRRRSRGDDLRHLGGGDLDPGRRRGRRR